MYCTRVTPGTERKQVQRIVNGVLPLYQSVDEYGRGGKHLVVPGYVFTSRYTPGTAEVPENEWMIIKALSNPTPSVFDHANRTFAEGPLKAVEEYITDVEAERIRISVKILGENREYWPAVKPLDPVAAEAFRKSVPEEPVPADDGKDETGETQKTRGEKTVFTPEQEAEILARAEEVGTRQAAEEYSVSWQVIAGMKRRARGKNAGAEAPEKPKAGRGRKAEADTPEETEAGRGRKAEADTPEETEAGSGKKRGRRRKSEVKQESAGEMPAAPNDADALQAENAALRERVAKLEIQAEKLKMALRELL